MLRLERHPFGPRVYVLRHRIHEYHLGLAVLAALAVGAFFDVVDLGLATTLAAVVGVWLVAKDWRDLVPSKRDSASWQLGLHRRAAPLRGLRRSDSLPTLAALAALTAGIVNLVPEGLILLVSLTAAVSAFKVARRGVLAQQLNAVESLASVDIVCTDKTGTLTEPNLRVVELLPATGTDEPTLAEALATYAAVDIRHPILIFRSPWDLETIGSLGAIREALAAAI